MGQTVQSLTVLLVSDLEKSKAFFKDILGCEITDYWALREKDIQLGFKLIEAADISHIHPNTTGQHIVPDTYAYADNFESLDNFFAEWKDKGATIVKEPTVTNNDWGDWKEFYVEDPDGYVIGVGSAHFDG